MSPGVPCVCGAMVASCLLVFYCLIGGGSVLFQERSGNSVLNSPLLMASSLFSHIILAGKGAGGASFCCSLPVSFRLV